MLFLYDSERHGFNFGLQTSVVRWLQMAPTGAGEDIASWRGRPMRATLPAPTARVRLRGIHQRPNATPAPEAARSAGRGSLIAVMGRSVTTHEQMFLPRSVRAL